MSTESKDIFRPSRKVEALNLTVPYIAALGSEREEYEAIQIIAKMLRIDTGVIHAELIRVRKGTISGKSSLNIPLTPEDTL